MERWREMFRGADIYDVIRNAILIAGADSPRELLRRRQGIIEWLFAVAPVTVPVPAPLACGRVVDGAGNRLPPAAIPDGGGHHHDDNDGNFAAAEAQTSLIDQQILEALYDEIEEDTQVINEVLRIKDILINYKEQSVDTLFDGLRRLQLMRLSISVLKSTQIAEAVAPLNKHRSPVICKIARDLAKGWKGVAADWVGPSSANADTSPDISNPSTVEDDFGLPTPPMDVGAFFLPQSAAEQYVSEFLHKADDDDDESLIPNAKNDCGFGGYKMEIAKPVANMDENILRKGKDLSRQHGPPMRQANLQMKLVDPNVNTISKIHGLPTKQTPPLRQTNLQLGKTQGPRLHIKPASRFSIVTTKPNKPTHSQYTSRSQFSEETQNKYGLGTKPKQAQHHAIAITEQRPIAVVRKPLPDHKLERQATILEGCKVGIGKRNNTDIADLRLEATKRKLNDAYQEAENKKRKRCVQYVDMHDVIPNLQQRKATTTSTKQRRNRPNDRFSVSRSRK
ncbi:hypothetical protein DAI22_01g128700 [Oryza sativa Japonica Group]|nr:hypothetical protein DAI22_01g128700 [Oryza sativa Japonica Group]